MDIGDMTKAIAFIPKTSEQEDKSFRSILIDIGYFEKSEYINEKEVESILRQFPELIDKWLQYSDDQRTSPSWYFINNVKDKYAVCFSPYNEDIKEQIFSDRFMACAYFIKRMIERTRAHYQAK